MRKRGALSMEVVIVIAILLVVAAIILFIFGGGSKRITKSIGLDNNCAELNGIVSQSGKCPPESCSEGDCSKKYIPKIANDCGKNDGDTCRCCTGII